MYEPIGTRAATRNSIPRGLSRASTSAGRTGTINSRGHRHPRQHRPHLPLLPERCCSQCGHRGPTTSPQSDEDEDDDDDDDDDDSELTKLLAMRARRRAAQARYRARHPERVAEQRRRYRAKHPEVIAAQKQRYRERYRAKHLEALRRDYVRHVEKRRASKREHWRSEKGQVWWRQKLARQREAAALLKRSRDRERTLKKIKALGPLKLTVTLEDFMQDFCNTLSPTPEDSVDQPSAPTIMDMDSATLHPLDHSCDMWDDGRGFLDNLLEELGDLPWPSSSSSDDSLCDSSLSNDSLCDSSSGDSLCDSSSDDSLFELLRDVLGYEGTPQDSCFDLDDFVS